jgi:hypothetical protein
MRRILLACLTAAGIVAVPLVSAAQGTHRRAGTKVTVTPDVGAPPTQFVLSFVAPARTGVLGLLERRYQVRAVGPQSQGCGTGSAFAEVPPTRKGQHVAVTLAPARGAGGWCVGTFRGRLQESDGPVCRKGRACPQFKSTLRTVGRFSFRVVPAPGGTTTAGGMTTAAGTTPPTFAGLQSAFACTPGPQRPGQTTPFTLSWQPATDVLTPAAAIVYDVFASTTPGGENYATPTWTTPPGVTSFKTPGLPSHGTFYFVVRARDQAGNEDQNQVERRGSDPCL